jgi:hypothetical protein
MPLIKVPGGSLPQATVTTPGALIVAPQVPVTGAPNNLAQSIFLGRQIRSVYNGATRNTYTSEILGSAVNADIGTASDGSDADGAAVNLTGTEAFNSLVKPSSQSWTTGQIQRRFGLYAWCRFKLPSTMTSLTSRTFGCAFISNNINVDAEINAANLSAATTLTFIVLRWRWDTNGANWSVRVGDGANAEDALDTGVAIVTNTLYHVELFSVASSGNVYLRINGGANQQIVSTRLPATTFNFTALYGMLGYNNAAVTGTGAIVVKQYSFGASAN